MARVLAVDSPSPKPTANNKRKNSSITRVVGRIAIQGIYLDAPTDAARALGRQERGATSQEGIQHHLTPVRAIEERVHHELDQLCRWMQLKEIVALAALFCGAVVVPNVATVASIFAEFNIIGVALRA
jgi:hypothetical protein